MEMIKLVLAVFTTTLLFACSNEIKSSQVVVDMPVSDLVDAMGEPDYIEDNSDVIYSDVKPLWVMLVKMEQEAKATNIKELSLDEKVESADGEIDKANIEAYILNGRVIYKRFVASE